MQIAEEEAFGENGKKKKEKSKFQLGVDKFPEKKENYYKGLKAKYSACRITREIANDYYKKAENKNLQEQIIELRNELIENYGVTELEAINILNGFHISDYVKKYELMSQGIFFYVNGRSSDKNR